MRLPRARGDGPRHSDRRTGQPRASPRSRGWTRRGALPTQTVVNDTCDFYVGRRPKNLDARKAIDFAANQRLSASDASATTAASEPNGSNKFTPRASWSASAPPRYVFSVTPRVQGLFAALVLVAFRLLPEGFANRSCAKPTLR